MGSIVLALRQLQRLGFSVAFDTSFKPTRKWLLIYGVRKSNCFAFQKCQNHVNLERKDCIVDLHICTFEGMALRFVVLFKRTLVSFWNVEEVSTQNKSSIFN